MARKICGRESGVSEAQRELTRKGEISTHSLDIDVADHCVGERQCEDELDARVGLVAVAAGEEEKVSEEARCTRRNRAATSSHGVVLHGVEQTQVALGRLGLRQFCRRGES